MSNEQSQNANSMNSNNTPKSSQTNAIDSANFEHSAISTSIISIIINLLLSVFKLIAGIVASSASMISDAIHSASDVFSTIVVIIGIKISSKAADEEHPYGHERFECIAALILAAVLFATGGVIGWEGVKCLFTGSWKSFKIPGILAMVAAGASILTKELMYQYTKYQAKKINSTALMADAWHHRSDALSSIGALIGIYFARKGLLFMDSVASVIICIFILKAAFDICKDSIDKLVDKACPEEFSIELNDYIKKIDGVKHIDSLLTRSFGNKAYVDIEIAVDCNLSICDAHEIAEKVHDSIEKDFSSIKHVTVHVNPYIENQS